MGIDHDPPPLASPSHAMTKVASIDHLMASKKVVKLSDQAVSGSPSLGETFMVR